MNITRIFAVIFSMIFVFISSATAAEYKRITRKSEFIQTVIGKNVAADWGWVSFGADGKIAGDSIKGEISGHWKWKGKFYCRNISVGGEKRPYDCLTVFVAGKNIVFIREKGRGEQMQMKIK
jgi:hypothetical protein